MVERGVEDIDAGAGGNASRPLRGNNLSGVTDLITHRSKTHGDFKRTAEVAQKIKAVLRDAPNWDRLSSTQREALDHMYSKVARILCGNPRVRDHWADIAGYAQLVADDL